MITLEIQNQHAVLAGLNKASKDVKAGASEGIKQSLDEIAKHVAIDTPVKSGKARASVYSKMTSELRGEAGYGREVRWYMRIVDLSGARPHVIIAKALKGKLSGITKGQLVTALKASRSNLPSHYGESRSFKRNVSTFDSTRRSSRTSSKQRLFESLKRAGVDQARLKEFRQGLKLGARALSFESHGALQIKSVVLHPGIKSRLVLRRELIAAQGMIAANVRAGIQARLGSANKE